MPYDVTYLGNASVIVEICGLRVAIDPVFTDRFQDGIAECWPPRELDRNKLPVCDLVVVTHGHPGHLEIESLAMIDRQTNVICSNDPSVLLALRELGFSNIEIVAPGQLLDFGSLKCLMTGSHNPQPEVGCILIDGQLSRAIWYMSDQAADETALDYLEREQIDLDLLLCNVPFSRRIFTEWNFEIDDEEMEELFRVVARCKPALVAPNLIGWRYVGAASWLNRATFPYQPQDFVELINDLVPETTAINLLPGDIVSGSEDGPLHRPQACDYTGALPDQAPIRFDPTKGIPELEDPGLVDLPPAELRKKVKAFFLEDFSAWLAGHPASARARKVRIDVVYPSGDDDVWVFDTTGDTLVVFPASYGDKASLGGPNVRIAATVLIAWIAAEMPYYHVFAYSRPSGVSRRVLSSSDGQFRVERVVEDDILSQYFNSEVSFNYHRWLAAKSRSLANI